MTFKQHFRDYACEGDTITCERDGFTCIATIYRDDDHTPPDERQDGYWPSLDPKSDGYIGAKSESALRRATVKAKRILQTWKEDEWFYCGVAVTVERAGVRLTGQYDHACWGIECNYPSRQKNHYLRDVANSYLPEALEAANAKLDELLEATR